jgi:putative transposase
MMSCAASNQVASRLAGPALPAPRGAEWIRRDCWDHIVIFNERDLRRVLSSYVDYYQRTRTHLSLDKDCPDSRPIQHRSVGRVVAIPKVGGLHHRYERLAA